MAVYTDLVRYRELFANLFRRNFHARYRGSVLGLAWSLVNPLALMAVYLLVFSVIMKQTIPHYSLYLLTGITCWTFLATSLQAGARSLVDSAELIRKVRFPRQLVAFSVVATQLVTFALMLAIVIVLSLILIPHGRAIVWLSLPLAVLFAALVAGISLIAACLNTLFRDIEHILAAALLPWFFLTPILWAFAPYLPTSAQGHHKLLAVLRWGNFVAPPIIAIRDVIWRGQAPRAADVIYLVAAALIALAGAAFLFRKLDDRIAVEL